MIFEELITATGKSKTMRKLRKIDESIDQFSNSMFWMFSQIQKEQPYEYYFTPVNTLSAAFGPASVWLCKYMADIQMSMG
ncbi:hypothetical protein [Acidicapsa ligni]|uniref:hypothetical protein n=1 Tax=Acidicapsa ligni TaxID=542300 RepID=UPI0021DFF60C|nr:hypothetical protein [Acidicapsa ligni]